MAGQASRFVLLVTLALALPAAASGGGPGPGAAAEPPPVLAGPGGFLSTYLTPVAVAWPGGPLTFANLDFPLHDVVAQEEGPADQPWCALYPDGGCPRFWTPLIGLGQSTPVLGLETLAPGASYRFTCTLHPWMQGVLVAVEPPEPSP